MANSRSGLGRGLSALIPEDFDTEVLLEAGERIEQIAVDRLAPNPEQPRSVFDDKALAELAESIKKHGIVQPLVVQKQAERYQIIAGERRWRAAKLASLRAVPVIVRTLKQQEQLEIALIENVQRVDLGPLEQAASIERLHQQFGLTYGEISSRLGKAETTINNIVRLRQLPAAAAQALADRDITEGHARQILALKNHPEKQAELLRLIRNQGWNVRQAERYVSSVKTGLQESKAVQTRMASETPETKRLSKRYGAPVRIYRTAKGGRVEIAFRSDEELASLLTDLAD